MLFCIYFYVFLFFSLLLVTDENNVIQELANNINNIIENDEMTYERNSEIHRTSPSPMNHAMIWINDQPSTDYANERTISSSSSEQLIPKEKQTGKENEALHIDIFSSFSLIFFRNVSSSFW